MIPVLSPHGDVPSLTIEFLDQLGPNGFSGDIERSYSARLSVATDNSAFQSLPSAVLFPRDEQDIVRVFELLAEPAFHDVYLAPRGGGTSTIGCSLTQGVVLDCSRHMNQILEIDPAARSARVQPGVVLDQLNDALAEYGLFFAPNVAPSSRATLGGMANTDGCGKGSRVYGKTSDHVLASRLVLTDGSCFAPTTIDEQTLGALCERDDRVGEIHRTLKDLLANHAGEIRDVYPSLSRYLSGYNLAQLCDESHSVFNLNKLICGSEGTLAVVSELTLNLTPIPGVKTLFALRYDSFDSALRDAERLVTFDPGAIETLDDKVMGLARDNPIYARVRDTIENEDGSTPAAVNLIEFSAIDADQLAQSIEPLQAALSDGSGLARGFYRADKAEAIASLWELRKGGVGLLGSTPGDRKPLPFVEDTVVDPRNLAAYVADFRALLDEYGLEYGMFGHIDVGCLHVRPALNLADPDDERIMREITDRVDELVRRHGGMIWNEHGKGYRSQYNPQYFGERLYAAMGELKRVFDPQEQLNPGKIVAATTRPIPLASMSGTTRGAYDRQIDANDRQAFANAVHCNGNGACFNYNPGDVMCPSYRATRDRLHSPKGRAGAMREWLRQLAAHGSDTTSVGDTERPLWRQALQDITRPAPAIDIEADFSHEVWQAMDGCLSCRACATQCPVKVNVPDFKSRFLALYHGRYRRPPADYALAWMERGAQWASLAPGLANILSKRPRVRRWLADSVGLSDAPRLSSPSLPAFLRANPQYRFRPDAWLLAAEQERQRTVIVVQDAFTSFFDAEVAIDVLRLIERLGYLPQVADFVPSGKPLQVKGFTREFRHSAQRMQGVLSRLIDYGRPVVTIEPSVALAYEHDYPPATGRATPAVQSLEAWLAGIMASQAAAHLQGTSEPPTTFHLFQHCTAATHNSASAGQWQQVFDALNMTLHVERVGCCGMSGAYGHETRHRDTSHSIFDLSWRDALKRTDGVPLVPGYSCRSQVRRCTDGHAVHPASALLALLPER